tara:strand:+ start:1324 stop:1701 length:378 start_codon:yes stop_codon:yes gene_type:complete
MMTKEKKPDNIILFPKVPRRPMSNKAQELDAKRQEMIRLEHNKIFVQAVSEDLTETMLMRLKDEGVNLVDPTFLKDYKLLSEALKSLILRHVHMKHPLQERVDRSITTKGEGKNLYAITIDYKKF